MHTPTLRPFSLLLPASIILATLGACDTQAPASEATEPVDPSPAVAPTGSSPADSSHSATAPKGTAKTNASWWPEQVDLAPLRRNEATDPYGGDFDYVSEFDKLDLDAVEADIKATLTDSQDWWPADYGNYGPLFIRMAWHSAGTYRALDGRGGADGGQQRFEPLNSWPDNANLDKARRLLWPVKRKYGRSISWADLMVLSGNVALESMGFETLGFAGGREDDWQADVVYWGPESKMLADERYHGERTLQDPLAAVQMGLIYVNPEGPNGSPDPHAAVYDIRDTFARMGMNDEETVALIAGGHTFGKAHGAHDPSDCVGVEPAAAGVQAQGMGWHNRCGSGRGVDTVTSGLEGAWTTAPVTWTHQFFANLYEFDWERSKSPAGATQWKPKDGAGDGRVPDAHDASKHHPPMMLTTDLALKEDAYGEISRRFMENPEQFEQAFAHAWFKLTHRDLGPRTRYLGADAPKEPMIWQDPLPERRHALISDRDASRLKRDILASKLSVAQLVKAAWASASTYRDTDMRGGANGARVRLQPQVDWAVNDPAELAQVVEKLEAIQTSFNASAAGGTQVSLADLIVLGGAAAIEEAARGGGQSAEVPVVAGRVDADAESTDVVSFAYLRPKADAFRNYYSDEALRGPTGELIEKAALLGLTVSEMTALVGGLRVLGANAGDSEHGVLTDRPGTLSNDFFVNLLDLSTTWTPRADGTFEGVGPEGEARWTATEVDLVFGSNSELRAICEVYVYDAAKFQADFIDAWTKVMQADRFDLHR